MQQVRRIRCAIRCPIRGAGFFEVIRTFFNLNGRFADGFSHVGSDGTHICISRPQGLDVEVQPAAKERKTMKLHNRISVSVTSATLYLRSPLQTAWHKMSAARPQSANQTNSPGVSESVPAAGVNLATCSPDGEYFVSVTPSGHVKYGRTIDGKILRTWCQCYPKAVVFSPDGRLLAAAGSSSGCPATIKVWRVEDGALLCKIQTETGSNPRLSFSADGAWLASTGAGLQINLWQLPEGTPKWSAPLAQNVSDMSFASRDQSVVVIFADGSSKGFPVK
ncbi:MAG: hypothetical protein QOE70_5778 [Chthoniobacter sp.]|nr:hypothetical protein [Chthoniobacter sp.]